MDLPEILWTLRSGAGLALRIELLRKTWPRAPPEWLEEQEAQDLLRSHLESEQLPLVLEVLHAAPTAWRGHGACAGQLRTRTLLAMVEPCELHVLHVHLSALLLQDLQGLGPCRLRLRLAEAGSWMESPSFWLGPATFSATTGCLLDHHFRFAVPVATGDSIASLFQHPTVGLEIQLLQNDSCVLQGELSALDFLAHLEGPDQAVSSCIQLAGKPSSSGLQCCSVPGVLEGPQLVLEVRDSHAEAALDALPYWMEPQDMATAALGAAREELGEVEIHRLQLSLHALTPMPSALETAMARAEELQIRSHHSSLRVRAMDGNGSVLCGATWGEQMDEPKVHIMDSNLQLYLVLELLLWSDEGSLSSQLCLCHQPLELTQLDTALLAEPLRANVPLGSSSAWAKLELELAVPQEMPADSPSLDEAAEDDFAAAEHPAAAEDVTENVAAEEAAVIHNEPAPEQPERQEVDDDSMVVPSPRGSPPSPPASSSRSPAVAERDDLEQWLEHQSPRALLSRVVEVAQLAAEMVSKPKEVKEPKATETLSCGSPPRLELAVTTDVPPCAGGLLADVASNFATLLAKEQRDETSTVCSMELWGPGSQPGPRRLELPDEPEPAAESEADAAHSPGAPCAKGHVLGGPPKSSGAAPMPRREAPSVSASPRLTAGSGAGIPPPKISAAAAPSSAASVCQLGGRGPLPPELVASAPAVSAELPRDGEVVTPPTMLEVKSPEPEELPMVSFPRRRETTPPMSPASFVPALNESTLTSQRLDSCATHSPPWRFAGPAAALAPPRWAQTWASSSPWPSPQALGSTRSTMTPRQRLAELAADVKASPSRGISTMRAQGAGLVTTGSRWSDRIDVNTKRLARIMRSMASESSDSS